MQGVHLVREKSAKKAPAIMTELLLDRPYVHEFRFVTRSDKDVDHMKTNRWLSHQTNSLEFLREGMRRSWTRYWPAVRR